ncbi:hypothetical protein [Pragia fontium]|uniref:hypothetical protein n=1 Tax=Pragia fontium TaxID=82985 RepID=UPI00064A901C|nr:hypothetical protein [Pragia fontium]AKJ40898.1 hypothetical protein QQ39_01390 [Pragia fontium]
MMVNDLDIDWRRIVTAPRWLRHALAMLISAIPAVVCGYWVMLPVVDTGELLHQKLAVEKQFYQTYQQQRMALPESERVSNQLRQLEAELHQYHNFNAVTAEFVRYVTDFIYLSGCQLLDIKRLLAVKEEGFTVFRWQLKIQAGYFQFIDFIHLVNDSVQIITINELTMEGSSLLTLNMTVSLYQLNREPS